MSIQGKIIREYALPTIWLNVGIYIQNWLSKVVQIYRKRYLHGWWARKHRCYWLVTFEKRAVLVNKIHMTRNTHMDEYIIFSLPLSSFHSFFFFWQQLFTVSRIIAWHWHRNCTICSYRTLEEKQSLPPVIGTHVLGLCFFGGVFDPQQVSEACLPKEHRANIVGNLFYSWWRQRRLWRLWTSPYLQEIADPRDFFWKIVWKFFTGTRNECETVLSF